MSEFGHMGIFVRDIEAMESFYRDVLGLCVTDKGTYNGRNLVFLSGNENEHHQIVLAEGRSGDSEGTVINQISIKAKSLAELRLIGGQLLAGGVNADDISPVDHGTAWSLYFTDPDGNRVELYTATPYYVPQPAAEQLDLTLSDTELAELTRTRYCSKPGFRLIGEWQEEFRRQLDLRRKE